MHKRRIDLLTPILSEINSQFYLQICRQLQYEIGEIYSEMTDFKIAVAEQEGKLFYGFTVLLIGMILLNFWDINFYTVVRTNKGH